MEGFRPLAVYTTVATIRYFTGVIAGAIVNDNDKIKISGVIIKDNDTRKTLVTLITILEAARIPLEILLSGENANPMETSFRIGLEYISIIAGIYGSKLAMELWDEYKDKDSNHLVTLYETGFS